LDLRIKSRTELRLEGDVMARERHGGGGRGDQLPPFHTILKGDLLEKLE